MKIVINACFGGFGLSDEAVRLYADRKGLNIYPEVENRVLRLTTYWTVPPNERPSDINWHEASDDERRAHNAAYDRAILNPDDIPRDDPDLVAVVEHLGAAANGLYAELKVVEIPDGVKWEIDKYDGNESVAEVHRTWA